MIFKKKKKTSNRNATFLWWPFPLTSVVFMGILFPGAPVHSEPKRTASSSYKEAPEEVKLAPIFPQFILPVLPVS